jgi:hypothetical protein
MLSRGVERGVCRGGAATRVSTISDATGSLDELGFLRSRWQRLPTLLGEGVPSAGKKPLIATVPHHPSKSLQGTRVEWLKSELVCGDTTNAWARIVRHAIDQRSRDIDCERARLAPLTSDRVDGVAANQRRRIMQGCEKSSTTTLVGQVIHECHTRSPNPWPRVRNASHEKVDGLHASGEEVARSAFADVPKRGVQGEKVIRRIGGHATPISRKFFPIAREDRR